MSIFVTKNDVERIAQRVAEILKPQLQSLGMLGAGSSEIEKLFQEADRIADKLKDKDDKPPPRPGNHGLTGFEGARRG